MCEETGVNETSSSAAGGDISFSDPKSRYVLIGGFLKTNQSEL
ncbi:hypothetical protein A943_01585 [Bacillus sp. CPSM8]|nr:MULTISPECIES: hypothetical protein [Bacillus]ETB73250.1 hypothetical protein A943_01585 [Bacillus sp. CPSM8]